MTQTNDRGGEADVNPRCMDAFGFARSGRSAQGTVAIMRLSRVVEDLPEQPVGEAGLVRWSVRGEVPRAGLASGQSLLHLRVQACPVLVCQRCSMPFTFAVDSVVVLQLVKSEAELDIDDDFGETQEEDSTADQPEKVVGSHRFDLLAQVEDELILSIPYVPRHEVCPGAGAQVAQASEEPAAKRPSPFAVLEKLKQKD